MIKKSYKYYIDIQEPGELSVLISREDPEELAERFIGTKEVRTAAELGLLTDKLLKTEDCSEVVVRNPYAHTNIMILFDNEWRYTDDIGPQITKSSDKKIYSRIENLSEIDTTEKLFKEAKQIVASILKNSDYFTELGGKFNITIKDVKRLWQI